MKDKIFRGLLYGACVLVLLLCAAMIYSLVSGSWQAFGRFGFFRFLFSAEWDPTAGKEEYGAWAFVTGTLYTSFLALVLCIPFSLPVALFTGEYFKKTKLAAVVGSIVDLLAGIPSIVYGLWGFYTLCPLMKSWGLSDQDKAVIRRVILELADQIKKGQGESPGQ